MSGSVKIDLIKALSAIRPSGGREGEEKWKKIRCIFNLPMSDRILMKFDISKDLESLSSYFESQPYPVILGELEVETGNLGNHSECIDRDETWWEE